MKKKSKFDAIGLRFAIDGLKHAILSERNFKVHIIAAVIVAVFAVLFSTSAYENLILVLTVGIVLFAELVNTSIERIVDLVCKDVLKNMLNKEEYNHNAKMAKDIAAGAVLVTSVMAVCIGIIIFVPKILERFF